MTKVIKFPAPKISRDVPESPQPKVVDKGDGSQQSSALVKGIYVVLMLLWPLLRYVVILDCVFQFFRMLWFWNTPGTVAGFKFMLHFSFLVWCTWMVAFYQPKGL